MRIAQRRMERGMDMTWVTERVALGGGIWNARNMEELAQSGVTHVINMQIEFDDRPLAELHGIRVLWNPTDDDFLPKPPELLRRGVSLGDIADFLGHRTCQCVRIYAKYDVRSLHKISDLNFSASL